LCARKGLSRISECRGDGEVAPAERIHWQGASHGCEGAGAYKISFTNFTTGKNSLARKHQEKVIDLNRRRAVAIISILNTGRNMNTDEVANKVVELTRKQAWRDAVDALYDKENVSVEASGMGGESPEKRGIDAVHGKADWWIENMEVHSFKVSGPFVAHDRFVVQYDVDATDKNSKKRFQMSEVGVYTVKDGKIVREEFLPFAGKG
jgi:urease gamma subunit